MAELSNLGRYRARRVLGNGAMGVMHDGFDQTLANPRDLLVEQPKALESIINLNSLLQKKAAYTTPTIQAVIPMMISILHS